MVNINKKYLPMCVSQVYELLADSAVKIVQYCHGIMQMDADVHAIHSHQSH